jgi:hypothetical protein
MPAQVPAEMAVASGGVGRKLEANIRGGGKTVHVVFKYLSRRVFSREGWGRAEYRRGVTSGGWRTWGRAVYPLIYID